MTMLSAEVRDYPTNTQYQANKPSRPVFYSRHDPQKKKKRTVYPTASALALLLELTTNPMGEEPHT